VLDQMPEQILGRFCVFSRSLAQGQHVLAALDIHPHRGQHALILKLHAVDVR